jgi:hypothetical protein
MGRPERKISLGRHKRRWDNNIKIDLRELGLGWYELDLFNSG